MSVETSKPTDLLAIERREQWRIIRAKRPGFRIAPFDAPTPGGEWHDW